MQSEVLAAKPIASSISCTIVASEKLLRIFSCILRIERMSSALSRRSYLSL